MSLFWASPKYGQVELRESLCDFLTSINMDERTTAVLVSFYEAVSKTNYDYMRNKYFNLVVIIIIVLFGMVVYLYLKPRTRVATVSEGRAGRFAYPAIETRYVPYYINQDKSA